MAHDRLFVSLLGAPCRGVAVPCGGTIAIGRGRDCDLRVDDPLVSRRHAVVHGGDPAQFEELGSKNASVLLRAPRAEPLAPSRRVAIASGDVIKVGSRLVGIHHGGPAFAAMLPDGDAFEAQLARLCLRPPEDGQALAVIRIQLAKLTRADVAQAALYALTSAARGVIHSVLGVYDLSLLVCMTPAAIERELPHLAAQLGELGMHGNLGVAIQPRDGHTAVDLIAAASAALETIRAGTGASSVPIDHRAASAVSSSSAGNAAQRIRELERELAALRAAHRDPRAATQANDPAHRPRELPARTSRFVVGNAARSLVLPSGERVDLSRHASLRRIVLVLARRHRDGFHTGLSTDELFSHGWPGERADPFAGSARVRVALSRLRSLGLRELLVRADDGYVLAPELAIDLDDEPRRQPA